MGEIRSLRNDVELMHSSYKIDKVRRIMNDECRSEEPAAIRVSPNDIRRIRTGLRPFSLNGNRDKDE